MKREEKAFWATVIPAVILWNSARPVVLRWVAGNDVTAHSIMYLMTVNALVSCAIAIAAGYVAADVGAPALV